MLSPKGHPELAGVGIEYVWGKAKQHFRRYNDGKSGTFHERMQACMASAVLTLDRVRKFARRARDYRRVYGSGEAVASHIDVEKLRKKFKTHRSAIDFDTKFVASA